MQPIHQESKINFNKLIGKKLYIFCKRLFKKCKIKDNYYILYFLFIYFVLKSKKSNCKLIKQNIPLHIYMSDYDIKNLLHKDIKIIHGNLMSELPEQIMSYKYIDSNDSVIELGGNIGTIFYNNK